MQPTSIRRTHLIAIVLTSMLVGILASVRCTAANAQTEKSALSEKEVEQIREARYVPGDCILLFVKFLDARADRIHEMFSKVRRPGREDDTREMMEQFTSIADELDDNLDDYGPRHADLRKALPKIIESTEKWSSILKSPPPDEAYDVARKIALESIRDIRESATQMNADQIAWFKEHPPNKHKDDEGPIDIPR